METFPVAASSSGSWVCTSDWAARVFQSRRGEAGPCLRKALCRCLLLPGGCTSAGLGSERRLQTPPIALPLLSLVGFFLYCFKYQMFCALGRLYFISPISSLYFSCAGLCITNVEGGTTTSFFFCCTNYLFSLVLITFTRTGFPQLENKVVSFPSRRSLTKT